MRNKHFYKICQEVKKNLPEENDYIVGVSGGSDSLAVACAMHSEGYNVEAIIVDHQLQDSSHGVSEYAKSLLESYGIKSTIHKVNVVVSGNGMEDAARKVRYKALFSHGDNIVVGHTKNDQAETVLMGLKRGSGSSALTGMRIVTHREKGTIYRPMLENITKEDTQQACAELGLKYWDDPHNFSYEYTRVRVRDQVIPTINEQLGIDIIDKLSTTSFMIQQERDFISSYAQSVYDKAYVDNSINIDTVISEEKIIVSHVISMFIKENSGSIKKVWVDKVMDMMYKWNGQSGIDVKNGKIIRSKNYLEFVPC